MKDKRKSELKSDDVSRETIIWRSIDVNLNNLISKNAKLSYLQSMLIKHRLDVSFKAKIEAKIVELGFKKINGQWIKKR